jgi:hypothetical protein
LVFTQLEKFVVFSFSVLGSSASLALAPGKARGKVSGFAVAARVT